MHSSDNSWERQRDQDLQDAHRDINLATAIGAMKAGDLPPEDPTQLRIARKLIGAEGLLRLALERGAGFSDVYDAANEVLTLAPGNGQALTVRAIAHAGRGSFREAVRDAEKVIALGPNCESPFDKRMRAELPVWRKATRD
jgi:Flp pilus assembly protein TadD